MTESKYLFTGNTKAEVEADARKVVCAIRCLTTIHHFDIEETLYEKAFWQAAPLHHMWVSARPQSQ